jgi:4-oxalocrotonate tautomerase
MGDFLAGRKLSSGRLIGFGRTANYEWRTVMPLINVKIIEGVFSAEQKTQIIRKLTDAMVEIEGEAMRPVTWTVIEEVRSGEWGIAGKPLTTADVRALAAARPAKVG